MEINIEDLVKERIDDMDLDSMVLKEIRGFVWSEMSAVIKDAITKHVDAIITDEIAKVMDGEVRVENGWGSSKYYDSFEDLFKKTLSEKMKGQWEVQKKIEKLTKDRVAALIQGRWDEVVEKGVDSLTCSKLVKK